MFLQFWSLAFVNQPSSYKLILHLCIIEDLKFHYLHTCHTVNLQFENYICTGSTHLYNQDALSNKLY